MQFVQKSSTLAQQVTSGRSTPARGFSLDVSRDKINTSHDSKTSTKDGKEAWEAVDGDGSFAEGESFNYIFHCAFLSMCHAAPLYWGVLSAINLVWLFIS